MITNQEIRRQVTHEATYTKGLQYYSKGKVSKLQFDGNIRRFTAEVAGDNRYSVAVTFDEERHVHTTQCNCQAFMSYSGACKHIVAVLKSIQMNWDRFWKADYRNTVPDLEEVAKGIFQSDQQGRPLGETGARQSSFDRRLEAEEAHLDRIRKRGIEQASRRFFEAFHTLEEEEKLPLGDVSIVPTLVVAFGGMFGPMKSLELQIKEERSYVIKNVREFIFQTSQGENIVFGKNFVFTPGEGALDDFSQKLLQFMLEMFWDERQLEDTLPGYLGSSGKSLSIFDGKRLKLTDSRFYSFLDLMGDKPFGVRLESYLEQSTHTSTILFENPSLDIAVQDTEDGVAVVLAEDRQSLLPLDRNGLAVFYKSKIYRVDKHFAKALTPILSQVTEQPEIVLEMKGDEVDYFFSRILPRIEKEASVQLAPNLEERIVREPMEAEVYLDQWQGEILADVVFRYGPHEVQPLRLEDEHRSMTREGVQLIRDLTSEIEFLNWFRERGFLRTEGSLRLDDIEAIGDFLYSGLEELVSQATVFRTERFLSMKLKVPNLFKIQCKLENKSGLLEMNIDSGGMQKEDLIALVQAHKLKKKYHLLKNGDLIAIHEQGSIAELDDLVTHLGVKLEKLISGTLTLPAYRAVYLDAIGKDTATLQIERDRAFKKLIHELSEPDLSDLEVPEELQSVLRDYQVAGFKWLKTLTRYGFGGILADDMGLGKTVQVLAFLLSEKRNQSGKALVVVPTSLMYNWQAEAEKFTPDLTVRLIHGTKTERISQLSDLENVDVVVTTYGLLKRDLDQYRALAFHHCIIDEAQHIKNANTLSAKSVKTIQARNTIALTGTPIENGLTELWSIFDFIMPGYLYQHSQFINRYATPIVKDSDPKVMAHLRRHIQPFVLRRLKQDVLKELPDKIESRMVNQMTTEQSKLYAAWHMRAKKEFESEVTNNGFAGSQIKILALLTRLRQLACHPSLFIDDYKGGSGKMEQLLELIEDAISGGHRLLVFSQFTTLLGLVKRELEERNYSYQYIDGSVLSEDRMKRVKAFNEGEGDVFLISLKAGGTGLNLTGADMVVHIDPWWNPAVEDQATDRAHRIGQTKVVQVFKLITKGTIEEKIDELKQRKRELIDAMITPGETWLTKMNEDDIRKLFE